MATTIIQCLMFFALRSNGIPTEELTDYDPFYGELAYQTYITDFDTLTNNYQIYNE